MEQTMSQAIITDDAKEILDQLYMNLMTKYMQNVVDNAKAIKRSEHLGQVGERLCGLRAVVQSMRHRRTLQFYTEDGHVIVWQPNIISHLAVGDRVFLHGTV